MFFRPGTFVSVSLFTHSMNMYMSLSVIQALFSMVFLSVNVGEKGQSPFVVNPKLWYFAVITIPLTIAVFIWWRLWGKYRMSKKTLVH